MLDTRTSLWKVYTAIISALIITQNTVNGRFNETETCNIHATSGGTGKGAPCSFPYEYEGLWYDTCISAYHSEFWCPTQSFGESFDSGEPWGNCITECDGEHTYPDCLVATLEEDRKGTYKYCVFPFTYEGIEYHECTDTDVDDGRLWCSTTSGYDGRWGYCGEEECAAPLPTGADLTVTYKSPTCDVPIYGETSDGNTAEYCYFPFEYRGHTRYDCITEDHEIPWCATTDSYTRDRAWGECAIFTDAGELCKFPFTYDGEEHSDCITTEDRPDPFCGHTSNLDQDTANWGTCLLDGDCNQHITGITDAPTTAGPSTQPTEPVMTPEDGKEPSSAPPVQSTYTTLLLSLILAVWAMWGKCS